MLTWRSSSRTPKSTFCATWRVQVSSKLGGRLRPRLVFFILLSANPSMCRRGDAPACGCRPHSRPVQILGGPGHPRLFHARRHAATGWCRDCKRFDTGDSLVLALTSSTPALSAQRYAANPSSEWRSKDAAETLVTAVVCLLLRTSCGVVGRSSCYCCFRPPGDAEKDCCPRRHRDQPRGGCGGLFQDVGAAGSAGRQYQHAAGAAVQCYEVPLELPSAGKQKRGGLGRRGERGEGC